MFTFEFKEKAAREIDKLSAEDRARILRKLKFYAQQENPLRFAEKLTDFRFGELSFRIGDYRIICDIINGSKIIILKVGHRRDIYKP